MVKEVASKVNYLARKGEDFFEWISQTDNRPHYLPGQISKGGVMPTPEERMKMDAILVNNAYWDGWEYGYNGGASHTFNSATFGITDKLGWTESSKYTGRAFTVSSLSGSALNLTATGGASIWAKGGGKIAKFVYGALTAAEIQESADMLSTGVQQLNEEGWSLESAGNIAIGSIGTWLGFKGADDFARGLRKPSAATPRSSLQNSANSIPHAGGSHGDWSLLNAQPTEKIIRQLTENACGPACAQTVLPDLDIPVTQSKVAKLSAMNGHKKIGRPGTFPTDLAHAMNTLAEGKAVFHGGRTHQKFEEFFQGPLMINLGNVAGQGHWVIAKSYDPSSGLVHILDPRITGAVEYDLSIKAIDDLWAGDVVIQTQ